MLLAALVLMLGADKALVEALQSDDSLTRTRAAYALARTHDPADGAALGQIERILKDGDSVQRSETVRGLLCRDWPGGAIPTDVEARVVKLLGDRDARVREAVLDGARCLPRRKAAALLVAEEPLADKRADGTAGGLRLRILRLGMELGVDELREPLRRETHKRSEFLFFQKDCTLESCSEDLAALAWLGEDVSWMREKLAKQGRRPGHYEGIVLHRLDAIAGDPVAPSQLAEEARRSIDVEVRRKALGWLIALPPAPRMDVARLLIHFVDDPDAGTRRRAAAALAAAPSRHAGPSAEGLRRAVDDPDPWVRLEAAVGLYDLRETVSATAESDPVVRAVRAKLVRP